MLAGPQPSQITAIKDEEGESTEDGLADVYLTREKRLEKEGNGAWPIPKPVPGRAGAGAAVRWLRRWTEQLESGLDG